MAKLSEDVIKNQLGMHHDIDESISFEEIDKFGDRESMLETVKSVAAYKKQLEQRITFINQDMTNLIPFTRENLYLMCAYSGHGKSTVAANVSYPLWKEKKKSLIISNEEPKQDILMRIACLELGYNFNDYKKGRMPNTIIKELMGLFPDISKYVKIVDVNYKDGFTTRVGSVKNALTEVQNRDYSCAMIDYFQLIKYSTSKPGASNYEVLDDLRVWLGLYIKNSNIPIVLFAQLHSTEKRGKSLDGRIKDCPTIIEPSTVVIEVAPDFEERTTSFIIHKDRFGEEGKRLVCDFDRGRFVTHDPDALRERKLEQLDPDTVEEEVKDDV
jgi:replicative DNA helicase